MHQNKFNFEKEIKTDTLMLLTWLTGHEEMPRLRDLMQEQMGIGVRVICLAEHSDCVTQLAGHGRIFLIGEKQVIVQELLQNLG